MAQADVPNTGTQDLKRAAGEIAGMMDGDGHVNATPDRPSRAHPDYDAAADPRASGDGQGRDSRGRFTKKPDAPAEGEEAPGQDRQRAGSGEEEFTDEEIAELEAQEALAESEDEETSEATDAEPGDDGEDTDAIRTLADLAEALETPIEELSNALTHTFQAAGEEVTVTLSDMVAGYRKEADYRRSTAKLAEDRRAMDAERTEYGQFYELSQHVVGQQFNLVEHLFTQDMDSPAMAALRDTDPAEWTARQRDIEQRIAIIRNARQQMAADYETNRAKHFNALRERENKVLLEAIPDFGESHVKAATEIMGSLGFAPQEISLIVDSRLIRGALELGALRDEVKRLKAEKFQAAEAAKRVKRKVPQLTKPGKQRGRPSGKSLERDKLVRARKRLSKSKSVRDAADVIENMGIL